MKRFLLFVPLLFGLFSPPHGSSAPVVHVLTIDATINPAVADAISRAVGEAEEAGAECLVIRLNTPGGLLKSTRVIVSALLEARVPVVVFVAPRGSQAASAGTFITLAAHVAAMATGTTIGAAHPVGMQGEQPDSVMDQKATNDAAAFIRSISEKRNRNVRWAEEAVRRSVSVNETEAVRDSVVDLVADDLADLLARLEGRVVAMDAGPDTLHTRGAEVVEREMDWRHRILDTLSDPNVAYILFLLGLYGLLFELYNPGSVVPGVVGAICLILALYALHTLPVNYAGLALILVGVILLLLEIKVTSYGLLTIGGAIALFFGSIMLIDSDSSLEFVRLSWAVIIPAVLGTVAFFLFAVGMGLRAQRGKPVTGNEGMIGLAGEALTDLDPGGEVRVHGEIWRAESGGGPIRRGSRVRVTAVRNLTLTVAPLD